MIKTVIGIDPGKKTGYAQFDGDSNKLEAVETLDFWSAVDRVSEFTPAETAVIVELPKSKHVWHGAGQNSKSMARTGVNVGSVLREAELFALRFIGLGYSVVTVHPQGKAKDEFVKKMTGYEGRTNEHTRDAIMLAWNHRMLTLVRD